MAVASIVLRSGIGIVAFVGMALLLGGNLSLLPLLMFLLIATRVYGPILTVMTLLPDMLYLAVSSRRLHSLMQAEPMQGRSEDPLSRFDVRFDGVSFAYQDREVLRDVTLTAPTGGITALVGPSGSGKSTLVKLAARFWDVQKGSVRIGGIDVKELDPEALMRHISFVFQDVTLFNDTIEGNIRIGKPGATGEEIRTAAEAACCTEFIERLPDGYQTMLGENGATLSGGERQRLSIARALLKGAPIILLDEATASLDPENEVSVQNAINRLVAGKTVLIIAHKLKTIQNADQILVLEEGRLVEQGRHSDLLNHGGLYERLWRLQKSTDEWTL